MVYGACVILDLHLNWVVIHALFALTHICTLRFTTTTYLTCVFPSFTNDVHIVGFVSNAVPAFLPL